jgi:hypothetical protein
MSDAIQPFRVYEDPLGDERGKAKMTVCIVR